MKHKLVILLSTVLLLAMGFAANSTDAHASGDYTGTDLSLTKVDDIGVYNSNFIINELAIDNTIYANNNGEQVYKITLDNDGFISLLLTARNVVKTVAKIGTGGSLTPNEAKLTATVYRDSMLLYPVVPSVTATGIIKGESTQKIALDQGTYYIAVKTDKYSNISVGNMTTITSVTGKAECIVYYQEVKNNEIYRPSNVGKENQVIIDTKFDSLLTTTNPKDYYKFELTDKALVKLNVMYGSKNSAKFVLYSTEREELITKTITGNRIWYNVEKFLEPGIYYCSLESITPYDGGLTNILITQTVYPLKLTQENVSINTYITVDTIDNPKEIRYVLGKLTNSELTSAKWNSGKVITGDLSFGVNKVGYYTVRVTDEYGNMFMQSIKVNTCDKKAPNKPVIKSYLADSFVISGTAEKSTTVIITIAGIPYKCVVSSKGNYKYTFPSKLIKGTLIEAVSQDVSGNISGKTTVTVK